MGFSQGCCQRENVNALDAAAVVLKEADGPLHYREITRRMLAGQVWTTSSKDPPNTLYASIAGDIANKGSDSRFVRAKPGVFALRSDFAAETRLTDEGRPGEGENDVASDTLSFADAAELILSGSPNQLPMHYGEITKRALERGLIQTKGHTTAASMYSAIHTEVRRQEERGESPRFVLSGRGMFGLTAWLPDEVAALIDERNREVRQGLLDRARNAPPADFESLVGQLLVAMGFEDVEVTNVSGDGGIDVRGTLVVGDSIRIRMAVQAKRWKSNVIAPVVQQVRGSLGAHEQGLIITTSDFSSGAKTEAQRSDTAPVALIGGEQLAALLAEHEIGARMTSYDLYTLDEVDSAEE